MTDDAYVKLREALDHLPGGFPETPSKVELEILKRLFTPEEAAVACQMTGTRESAAAIAQRAGLPETNVAAILREMVRKVSIWGSERDGVWLFRLSPYVVGVYEEQWDKMDHDLAHLFEHYWADGGAAGIMRPGPALNRVLPAQNAIKREVILPYDDIKPMLQEAQWFELRDCICRKQQDLIGTRKCKYPLNMCLAFSNTARPPGPHAITREQALKMLDQAEDIGLVHTVANVAKGVTFVCNCCGCCCAVLRGINKFGIENSVARANYYAKIDEDECAGCGHCEERCQVHAIKGGDGVAIVDRKKCIGCGLCATGCPSDAIRMVRRPDAEIVNPPDNYKTWEQQRLKNRGLA